MQSDMNQIMERVDTNQLVATYNHKKLLARDQIYMNKNQDWAIIFAFITLL